MEETRRHIDTVLIEREDWPEPDAVFVSSFGEKTGLGLMGGGDAEVWLTREESQEIWESLEVATDRVETKEYETFNEIYLQQANDSGIMVPGFVLVSNHRGEIGLYVSIKDGGGAQVWMTPGHSKRIVAALQAAAE